MSRNLRHKATKAPPAKKSARKSYAINESSDDDYSGVDLVSDSEEEEDDVRAAEEAAIIESEYEDDDNNETTSRPKLVDDDDDQSGNEDQSSWGGFDLDSEHNGTSIAGTPGASDFFSEAVSSRGGAGNSEGNQAESDSTPKPRRVHFASDSSSDESDIDEDVFPDIFLEQDRLDPRFRQEIENDHNRDNLDNVSDDGSFWDYNADNNGHDNDNNRTGGQGSLDSSSDEETSSGYETDEGETTEEDIEMATSNRFVNVKSVLRRGSTDSSSSEEEIQVTRRSPYARRGPQLGTWFADANKPYAIVDMESKKLVVVKGSYDVRRASFSGTPSRSVTSSYPNDFNMDESPMISNSGNVMMSAMSSMAYDMNSTNAGPAQAMGPPEAWFPFVSINADGVMSQDDHSSYDEDDIEDGDAWDIQDLLDFGDDGNEDDEEEDTSDANATDGPATPGRTLTSEDQVHPLLEHFDRTSVNAFRRNQTRHALITRNNASKDSLAFSGAFGAPIRGIKSDRLAAANSPITPVRRTKASRNIDLTPSSPAAAADNKRKFSGEQHGHKRSRSMV